MKKIKILLPLLVTVALIGCSNTEEPSSFTTEENESITDTSNLRRDLIIQGEDVEVEGGSYDYKVRVRPDYTLVLDIDLDIVYQEIDGLYNLHYEIDENKAHTMVVSGTFKNVVVNSPLVEQIHPEIVTKFVNIAESMGFFAPDENNSYEWIEEICADPKNWIQTNISDDSYSYKLDLKTDEGFSFVNALSLVVYGQTHGYSLSFEYELSSNS